MRSFLYGLAFVAGFFAAQYSVSDEDRGAEIEQAYLEGVTEGAKQVSLKQPRCDWQRLFTQEQ